MGKFEFAERRFNLCVCTMYAHKNTLTEQIDLKQIKEF